MKTNNLNPLMFRAYDIRGIYPDDINEDNAFVIGKSFGTYISKMGKKEALVGYDNRLSSPLLSKSLVKGITSTGINVVNLGLVTTSMYYYARYHLDIWSGIMITASHNPSNHNGFKMSFTNEGNALGQEIKDFYNFTVEGQFIAGEGLEKTCNIKDEYVELFKKSLNFGDKLMKVVVDCGNGTTAIVIKEILDSLPIEYELLYAVSDPTFPNHHPDPSVVENLKDLQDKVVELNYDLGLALDADGDRIGIVDHLGNIINSDLYMIIMYRFLQNHIINKTALYDVKCSKALSDELTKLGYNQIMNRTGNSYIYRRLHEEKLEFGGEYSGHILFNDRFPGFDDGIYAGLRMAEVMSITNQNIPELLEGINHYYSTDEIKISVSDEQKFVIMEKIKEFIKQKNYNFHEIDGIRVEMDDYWFLVRVSNTTPHLTLRFEAISEELLEKIKTDYMIVVTNIINSNI
ncbi:MAG: phosphomannomutase/phosphoglucomutase [Bacilli bacterium]|nr:phosphomannomutase/phosphoglucomutase [Bacilli bacterium]MDD4282178.1 phosphomannomutase/phosphoglucomutase [Bacilli bacterium]MDD4718543.1 phosphomannomutase/phosphoglucomutase [Bacilli bacterium]